MVASNWVPLSAVFERAGKFSTWEYPIKDIKQKSSKEIFFIYGGINVKAKIYYFFITTIICLVKSTFHFLLPLV